MKASYLYRNYRIKVKSANYNLLVGLPWLYSHFDYDHVDHFIKWIEKQESKGLQKSVFSRYRGYTLTVYAK